MKLSNLIRKFTYNPFMAKVIQFSNMRNFAQWIYYLLAWPRDNIKQLSFDGIKVQFYVKTYGELRFVEGSFTSGYRDERPVLKSLLEALLPGAVAYDIGASIGIHTVFMAKRVGKNGRIIAVEPDIDAYESLQVNLKLNDLINVASIRIALGESRKEGILRGGGSWMVRD